jgi:hypothetical protein
VIPIAFFVGLAVGRWWFLPVAAIGWTIVLVAFGIAGDWRTIVVGADLAVVNAAIGVALHRGLAAAFRVARAGPST